MADQYAAYQQGGGQQAGAAAGYPGYAGFDQGAAAQAAYGGAYPPAAAPAMGGYGAPPPVGSTDSGPQGVVYGEPHPCT